MVLYTFRICFRKNEEFFLIGGLILEMSVEDFDVRVTPTFIKKMVYWRIYRVVIFILQSLLCVQNL